MNKTWSLPFSPWPVFSKDEIERVQEVLQSGKVNYWTGGEGKKFEASFANFCGTKYAIALSNGTAALELALEALSIGPGDEVIVTPRTFLASVSCVVTRGATPVFADVDPVSGNITASTIQKVLSKKTKAIIPVHLAGWPCEMDKIMALAKAHNLYVIEDCAQAHGAMYKGRPVGSIGHIGAFSFCQDKIMTTGGEGGMITTNDESLWKKAWAYKDHGKSYDAVHADTHPPGFRWLHESFGTNFRMTEMQAAIGIEQLLKLPEWKASRQKNAAILDRCIANTAGLQVLEIPEYIDHARYKYYTCVNPHELKDGWDRDRIREAIWDEGIPCFSGSCSEVYNEKAFDNSGFRPEKPLSNAQELGETTLMFLIHPTLTPDEMNASCRAIEKIMALATN